MTEDSKNRLVNLKSDSNSVKLTTMESLYNEPCGEVSIETTIFFN